MRRIFDVALAELARVGLAALSVPDVARKAGVNKTSVYRRWPTKEALVKAALDSSMQHARDVPDTGSFRSDLTALLGRVVEFLESPRGGALIRTLFLDGHNHALRKISTDAWAEAAGESPAVIVMRAVERGELDPSTDVELLLFTAAGAVLHRLFVERAKADAEWLERLLALLLKARPDEALPSSARGGSRSAPARASRRGTPGRRKA